MPEGPGRPTVMTEETVKQLEAAYSNDATDEQACFIAGISKQTLYNYQEEHPEFVDRKKALKNMILYQAKAVIKESLLKEKEGTETAKWYLDRKDKSFKPKQDITSGDKPFPIIDLSNAIQQNNINKQDNSTEQED